MMPAARVAALCNDASLRFSAGEWHLAGDPTEGALLAFAAPLLIAGVLLLLYNFVRFGNPLDTGRGRLIPTTSVDEYNAELARWFGIPNDSGLEIILPNIRNFYASGSDEPPIGFMA